MFCCIKFWIFNLSWFIAFSFVAISFSIVCSDDDDAGTGADDDDDDGGDDDAGTGVDDDDGTGAGDDGGDDDAGGDDDDDVPSVLGVNGIYDNGDIIILNIYFIVLNILLFWIFYCFEYILIMKLVFLVVFLFFLN